VTPALELVVARHREDLRWLRRVPRSIRITVYDKGGDATDAIPLPNVGREAHTYLHHIVTRNDALADVTVFAQGKPFDHVSTFHDELRDLAEGRSTVAAFRWFGFIVDWDDATGSRLFQNWTKNPDRTPLPLEAFARALWNEPAPERAVFYPGAHFAVTAATIRTRPLGFYERALRVSTEIEEAAHCFERTWDRVFGVDGLPEDLRGRDLPIYLKPIRRLMDEPL
jgi:hypothetical protein